MGVITCLVAIATHYSNECRAFRLLKARTALHLGDVAAPDDAPANRAHSQRAFSGEQLLHDVAVNVGEPELAPLELVGELGVVQSHQMKNGGVKIVDLHWIFNDVVTKIVCFP